jgi:hypothetical protein
VRFEPDITTVPVVWRFTGPHSFEVQGRAIAVAFVPAGEYQASAIVVTAEGEVVLGTQRIRVTSPASPVPASWADRASPPPTAAQPEPERAPSPPGAIPSAQTEDNVVSVVTSVTALPPVSALPEAAPAVSAVDQWLGPQLLSGTPVAHFGSGDLDGDGYADLVAAHVDSRNLVLFRGAGDGTFSAIREIVLGFRPDRVLVADFAGSALADIVAVSWTLRQTALLISEGPFAFGTPKSLGFPSKAHDLWAAQLNDHQASELIWRTASAPVVWSLTRTGQVVEWRTAPAAVLAAVPPQPPYAWADFTGDGAPEFAFYSHNPGEIFLVAGDSHVELTITPGRMAFLQLVAADVDGDGRLDIIGLDPTGRVYTLRSKER